MTKKKLVHNTKTSLREEAKEYLPTVKEFYPHLDDLLLDRISKYCAVYSKVRTKQAYVRQSMTLKKCSIRSSQMRYNSPYEIGLGDVVIMTGETGYKTEHLVLINYIKGETDAKGYTPKTNRTILVDNYGKRTTVHDYRTMEVA